MPRIALFPTVAAMLAALVATVPVIASQPSRAADLPSFTRGVSMELWTSWPAPADWGDAAKLFPFPEWRRTVTADDLAALKAKGLDFVRMPVDPGVFVAPAAAPHQDRLLVEIDSAVALIRDAGLNVIVDLHTIPGGDARPATIETVTADDEAFARYTDKAAMLARRLNGRNGVALELINEPVMDCETGEARWPAMMDRLHAAARDAAPDLPLVVTGACWGGPEQLAALTPKVTSDPLTLFSFHSYAPFLLTHQGATWAGDFIPHVTGIPFPPDRYGKTGLRTAVNGVKERMKRDAPTARVPGLLSYLDELVAEIDTPAELEAVMAKPMDAAVAFAAVNAIAPSRILMGEFGMIRQEWGNAYVLPDEWRVDYIRAKRALAEERGFGWAIWGYSGAFGVEQGFGGERLSDDVLGRVLR
ncbi:MAG: glycoside hydrolase family 5 protein [Rhizobiaceae bacterium]|nr:glycoside hydrolase family 5 protein [Rhizobiaceae bacterium]